MFGGLHLALILLQLPSPFLSRESTKTETYSVCVPYACVFCVPLTGWLMCSYILVDKIVS